MIKNWVVNSRMRELLKKISCPLAEDGFEMRMEPCKRLFFPPLKKVKDCVIISEKPVGKLEAAFDKALEMYMDKTGYEASNTETRLNSYFEKNISMEMGTKMALMVLEIWSLQLKNIEPHSKFCLILSCDEEYVEIRFHKIHPGEKMWLDENLEDYPEEAIGYAIV